MFQFHLVHFVCMFSWLLCGDNYKNSNQLATNVARLFILFIIGLCDCIHCKSRITYALSNALLIWPEGELYRKIGIIFVFFYTLNGVLIFWCDVMMYSSIPHTLIQFDSICIFSSLRWLFSRFIFFFFVSRIEIGCVSVISRLVDRIQDEYERNSKRFDQR